MGKLDQSKTPFIDAMKSYISDDVASFDVPGHHMGHIDNAATDLFGHEVYRNDVNAPYGLDNLAKPTGVILEAEKLFAEASGADDAFFLINGTSSGIIAMIMTAVKANEKIILPRNIHKSIVNGLIISGAIPEYVMPDIDQDLEIANQPSLDDYKKAILKYPSAKAVFVINPTYFGATLDLKSLVEFAHEHDMAVLVDEAHGAHFYFHAKGSPITAMDAGADLSAVSTHKTAGSLTQSSVLLSKNGRFSRPDIQKSLNIINSTSPSAILMASIDAARAFMASKEGKEAMEGTMRLSEYARKRINKIPGFSCLDRDRFHGHGAYDYDESRLVIALDSLDISGFDLYRIAYTEYRVQLELSETYAVLAIPAIGTTKEHIDRLIECLESVSKEHYKPGISYNEHLFDSTFPFQLIRPREAFHAPGKVVDVDSLEGCISKEIVMIYPPGIPFICPGEVWTKDLIGKVKRYSKSGISLHTTYPNGFHVVDTASWKRYSVYSRRLEDFCNKRKSHPLNDGYTMPFEGDRHKATIMLLPYRRDTWREKAEPGIDNYIEVIKAIAEHEPVYVGVHPCLSKRVSERLSGLHNVHPIGVRYNDAWARDNTPIFVKKGNDVRAVDFRFNAWGGTYDGLYSNWKDDDKLSQVLCKKLKYDSYYHPKFVFEGGAIHTDGEGTAIVTEACLLSPGRNPLLSKQEIEETLKSYLGLEKVIWVPHGIYNDETDEHVDNMVAYVEPGKVVMAWCENPSDPQYEFCQATYKALLEAEDAKGRKLVVEKILVPSTPLTMSEQEASTIIIGKENAISRLAGNRLAASYINFYQGHDFVVMPAFGVKEDELAYKKMRELFPNKKIHQIKSREILLGGGNIHCITMQIPEGK